MCCISIIAPVYVASAVSGLSYYVTFRQLQAPQALGLLSRLPKLNDGQAHNQKFQIEVKYDHQYDHPYIQTELQILNAMMGTTGMALRRFDVGDASNMST